MATVSSFREMSVEKLNEELVSLRREQFNLRMQQGSGHNPQPHLFTRVRRNIARVKTVLTETELNKKGEA